MGTTSALAGVKVLDLSRHLAGPYCAMMLGDLGADVIKIERPGIGDETRKWGPPFVNGESPYYLCCNRNKRSLTLDLKDKLGGGIARELAQSSDVLIENFRVGGAEEVGLGYDELKAINPRLIYCSISGFGHTGPDRALPGYDFAIQARGGLMSVTGDCDGAPTKVGVAIVDLATAIFASNAVLAALFARERSGQGQHLDIALLDSQIALLANVGCNYLSSGDIPQRWGNAHSSIVPYQAFQAADGYVVLTIGNDGQWERFCGAAGVSAWAEDERFSTNAQRVANRAALVPMLEDYFRQKTVIDLLEICEGADVSAAPVNTLGEVFSDPQVLARDMLLEMPHSNANSVQLPGTPLNFSRTPVQMRFPPPLLGQHTEEILTDLLGLDSSAVANLRQSGIV